MSYDGSIAGEFEVYSIPIVLYGFERFHNCLLGLVVYVVCIWQTCVQGFVLPCLCSKDLVLNPDDFPSCCK